MRGEEKETPVGAPYYAETLSPRLSHGWGELRALIDGSYKYIHGPRPELYNLDDDPGEVEDLAHDLPEVAKSMRGRLVDRLAGISSDRSAEAAVTPDPDTLERLAALGYVSAGGDQASSVREELRDDGEAPQDRVGDNSLVSAAKQQIFRQNYLAAKESALRLVELDADNSYYLGMLATAYLGLGQAEEAARIAEQAESIVPQNAGVFMQVAIQLFNGGLRERALALALKLESVSPSSYAHYIVGEMAFDTLKRTTNVDDKEAIMTAVRVMKFDSIGGPIDFSSPVAEGSMHPVPNVYKSQQAGGQWINYPPYDIDIRVCENTSAPDAVIEVPFKSLEEFSA
jgi:tetratricopeptide (TPR) repeat protein